MPETFENSYICNAVPAHDFEYVQKPSPFRSFGPPSAEEARRCLLKGRGAAKGRRKEEGVVSGLKFCKKKKDKEEDDQGKEKRPLKAFNC